MKPLFSEDRGTSYVPVKYPPVYDVLALIQSAGGIAVLAHPRVFDNFDLALELAQKQLIQGIEAYTPKNTKEDTERVLQLCEEYHLLATGGSDFHGLYNSAQAPIGSFTTPQKTIDALFALKNK